jgi:rRNA-processing protein FCF1
LIPLRTTAVRAAEQLFHTAALTTQVSIGGRSTDQILRDYLNWTEQAGRTLGNHFAESFVDDLIRTRDYWMFRTASGSEPRLAGEIAAELRRQERDMLELKQRLDALAIRWGASVGTVIAVPDTNMFLRPVPFWELPLDQYLDAQTVCTVVPVTVVHELDGRKRQNNTREAARDALRWLYRTLPNNPSARAEVRPNLTVEVYVDDDRFVTDPDASIIEVAHQLATLGPAPVRLITRDLAMRIRARVRGVEAVYLPEDPTVPAQP